MIERKTVKWLDRRVSAPPPYLALCLSEQEYKSAVKKLNIEDAGPWISNNQASATAHLFEYKGKVTALICVRDWRERTLAEIFGLLIHEAVHVWQRWCEYYGETNPGIEQEAYSIQGLAQVMIEDFIERLSK